ncbi:type I polyketide synthase [Chitinophaga sp. S165]|uniref:type I polyketide synthase n=1 Tax=Chitinophaga sp. S165 TaxID=2135462 RepID=UPI000D719DC4|nr:type I polyketide synthase [Chitinophaga sp. S165]PWV56290.1 acyl transferase domain-containing protein [Chitinophaga sp. S165]
MHQSLVNFPDITAALLNRSDLAERKITFVKGMTEEEALTHEQLIHAAKGLLGHFTAYGIRKGDELIIQTDDNKKFVIAFVACLLGGIIAVPLATGTQDEHKQKIRNAWRIMKRPFLFADAESLARLEQFFTAGDAAWWKEMQAFVVLWTTDIKPAQISHAASPDEIAYLQFSSGSTGQPKGIMISHMNVLSNVHAIQISSDMAPGETGVSWLPLTHDMGLVGCLFKTLLLGYNLVLIPTALFIRHPMIWMHKVDEHRGNIGYSPNFGYKYFLQDFESKSQHVQWDLSCLKSIYNGAESINHELISQFVTALKPHKISQEVMLPAYGMAEATLMASFHPYGTPFITVTVNRLSLQHEGTVEFVPEGSPQAITLVSCGQASKYVQIRITDKHDQLLADGQTGNIQLKGLSITSGYYQLEDADAFSADGWLKTGDTGFIHEGNLYIAGREKEMIIINGLNYYPYDLERVLEAEDGKLFSLTKTAAASVPDGKNGEELVIFIQYRGSEQQFAGVSEQVRKIIMKHFGLVVKSVVPVSRIPKTTSGKLQRTKLAEEYLEKRPPIEKKISQYSTYIQLIQQEITALFGITDIQTDVPLIDLGFDSLKGTSLINRINHIMQLSLSPTVVFEYPTIHRLAEHLATVKQEKKTVNRRATFEPVAIIGMAGKFPAGADDPEKLWELLIKGIDPVMTVPAERWRVQNGDKAFAGSFVDHPELFDAGFFGISPKEAAALDPQQRMLLETAFLSLQDAGYPLPLIQHTETGVFLGLSHSDYMRAHICSDDMEAIDPYSLTGTITSTAAGRLSYFFDLTGPAMVINTACSSSLAAIHYACNSLQSGDCTMAIAGGVNLMLAPEPSVALTRIQALSPDGRCKTFDAGADGYGRGEGCALVILKPLASAIENGDAILGVIRSSAINQDGKSNGMTAPNGLAQQRLLSKAIQMAGIHPDEVDYVEAHGTGTPLGDPLELEAMQQAYQTGGRQSPLLTGSLKSNIGHLESAAGIAGLIKVLLSFRYQQIPGNLHFHRPNPLIPWKTAQIKVVDQPVSWLADKKRIAGISSFGFSGTNAHAIIEAPVVTRHTSPDKGSYICTLSAHSIAALKEMTTDLQKYVSGTNASIGEITYNINRRNNGLPYHWHCITNSKEALASSLAKFSEEQAVYCRQIKHTIGFQFTGQGSQYTGMGKELYEYYPVFRQAIDDCSKLYAKYNNGISLSEIIFKEDPDKRIDQTRYTQPALFSLSYALSALYKSFGITPAIVMGHSIGEFTASCVAGLLTLEDAVMLISDRARLMQELPAGTGMMSLNVSEAKANQLITALKLDLYIACVNAPQQTVVSGKSDQLQLLKDNARDVNCSPLNVSHAFHSPLMAPAAESLMQTSAKVRQGKTVIPVISNVTGLTLNETQQQDPAYWSKHMLQAVRYNDSIHSLQQSGCTLCLEVGPQPVLTNMVNNLQLPSLEAIPSLRRGKPAVAQFMESLACLQRNGIHVDWKQGESGYQLQHLPIPPYPFQKKKYWMPLFVAGQGKLMSSTEINEDSISELVYQKIATAETVAPALQVILYDQQRETAEHWQQQLLSAGTDTIIAHISVAPEITERTTICYISNLFEDSTPVIDQQELLHLAALTEQVRSASLERFIIVTNNVHQQASVNLQSSMLWGFFISLKHELDHVQFTVVDVNANEYSQALALITSQLPATGFQFVIREGQWSMPVLEQKLLIEKTTALSIQKDKTYIVTGGFGSLGTQVVQWLVQKGAGHVVITGRGPLRETVSSQWEQQGCRITYIQMKENESLSQRLKNITNVKGIIHTAGAINDKLLLSHNKESFTSVFEGKVQHAWELHKLSVQWQPDFFVLFSSTVSLIGNAGQTNYGAANYLLNGLAQLRKAQQLPCVSICWGPWKSSAMAASLSSHFEQLGIHPFDNQEGIRLMESLMQAKGAVYAALDLTPGQAFPGWLQPYLPQGWHKAQGNEEIVRMAFVLPKNETGMLELVKKLAKDVLGLGEDEPLVTDRPYFETGFDSIMLNTLKNKLVAATGIPIPISHFFQYPTIATLSGYIFSALNKPAYDPEDLLIAEISMISDDEIANILNEYKV